MSTEDIRHIYCDGDNCDKSIDGYNPHAKNIDAKIVENLQEIGWSVLESEPVTNGSFLGFPLIIDPGETKHFCPICTQLNQAKAAIAAATK